MKLGKKIVISPYPKPKRDGTRNAKYYPYWEQLVARMEEKGHSIIQIGRPPEIPLTLNTRFNLTLPEIGDLVRLADAWISVDTFLPHYVKTLGITTPGAVLWGKSDPRVFGYDDFLNILKSRENLRKNQYHWWEEEPIDSSVWFSADEVYNILEPRLLGRQRRMST